MSKYRLISESKQADHAMYEKEILESIDHPFIVKFEQFSQDKRCIYMIQEFINGGEFLTLLTQKRRLDSSSAKFFSCQVALTLQYLHKNNVIYRDLKPENMLVDRSGYLRLIDFGLSKKLYSKTMTICGTPYYIAPEVLKNKGYSFEADWFSFGIFIYETLIGRVPFDGANSMEVFSSILYDKVRFPKNFNEDARNLISGLLRKDPTKRYTGRKVLNHKFFSKIDTEAMLKKNLEPPFFPTVKNASDTSNFKKFKISMLNEDN